MITAIEEDMKMIPISREGIRSSPNAYPSPTPAMRGIKPLRNAIQPMSCPSSLKLSNLVSRPAMNMRKMRPTSERKLSVGVTSIIPIPAGPITIPAEISASTQGRWKRRKAAAN
jgi:hypothetical protein